MYTYNYDSNSPFHYIYTCAGTLLCLQFTFNYNKFYQRIIEPLMVERRQVSIYSFMQLIFKFFVITVTKISSNTQRVIVLDINYAKSLTELAIYSCRGRFFRIVFQYFSFFLCTPILMRFCLISMLQMLYYGIIM